MFMAKPNLRLVPDRSWQRFVAAKVLEVLEKQVPDTPIQIRRRIARQVAVALPEPRAVREEVKTLKKLMDELNTSIREFLDALDMPHDTNIAELLNELDKKPRRP
jgi:hypothetical protein